MTVWIRDVEQETGRPWFTIFWTFDRYAFRSDGRCHTASEWEASLCQEAKRIRQPVEMTWVATNLGNRIASVSLVPPAAEAVL